MFLERQMPLPAQAAAQSLPVAVQRHTSRWFLGLTLTATALSVGVAGFIAFKSGAFGGGSRPLWHQLGPIQTIDVDGDGVLDPIGIAMHPFASDEHASLIAISGKTGAVLWESRSLGAWTSSIATAKIVTTKNTLFIAKDAGRLQGFDKATGATIWSAQLAEQAKAFCASPDESFVVVETADGAHTRVGTADGKTTVSDGEEPCSPVGGNHLGAPAPGITKISDYKFISDVLDMSVERVWQKDGSDLAVAFGTRSKGTHVPMVGVYNLVEAQPIWTAEAPAQTPLAADVGTPEGQIGAEHVVVMYEVANDTPHVTVFRLTDGKRLWDVEVPQRWRVTGLAIVGDRVLVTSAGLYSFDLTTGALQFGTAVTSNGR